MTRIKICGLMDARNALVAAKAGANYLGMIFADSRRCISEVQAQTIVESVRRLDPPPEIVGVFANSSASEVNRMAAACHLDIVQLGGDESDEYCLKIKLPIFKVIHISKGNSSAEINAKINRGYKTMAGKEITFLLDTQSKIAYGGTGKSFDWQVAAEVARRFPVIIAGGLTPENVGSLVKEVKPFGVDVSSGVETDHLKDPAKIAAFIDAIRNTGSSASTSKV